jgi:NADPH2:quinone reductase
MVHERFGPAEVLASAEVPMPELRADDLLVRVRAAGVNRADILQREGFYAGQHLGESALVGLELAGEVVAIAANVQDIAIGERVMAIVGGGAYAEYARVDRSMAVTIPASLSFEQAAGVMEAFVTAVEAVHHLAGLERSQTVLIQRSRRWHRICLRSARGGAGCYRPHNGWRVSTGWCARDWRLPGI